MSIINLIYGASEQPSPVISESFDFTDGTWDSTKINQTFTTLGAITIGSSGFTSSSSDARLYYHITDNGSKYHKITIKANGFVSTGWTALLLGIQDQTGTNNSDILSCWAQDYSASSYRGKNVTRFGTYLLNTQAYYGNAWYEREFIYDRSNGEWSFTINGNLIGSGTDASYSEVATKFSGDIWLDLDVQSGGPQSYIKTAEFTLE